VVRLSESVQALTKFRRDNWVVTYKIEFESPYQFGDVMVTEFFRGDKEECLRIKNHFGSGEHDQRRTRAWFPIAGPAEEWDDFLGGS
jgi:hypothetical protein